MRRKILRVLSFILGAESLFLGVGVVFFGTGPSVAVMSIVLAAVAYFLWKLAGPKQEIIYPPVTFYASDSETRPGKSITDAEIESLHQENLRCAKLNNWGIYRNNIYEMAGIYRRLGDKEGELERLIMVNYIDANEPNNIGSADPQILKEFPLFSPDNAALAPVPIERMFCLFSKLGIAPDAAKDRFSKVVDKWRVPVMPLSPSEAWAAICKYRE